MGQGSRRLAGHGCDGHARMRLISAPLTGTREYLFAERIPINIRKFAQRCASFARSFPGVFPQDRRARAYPEEFVDALTKAGWLAALIPEEYGGSGLSLAEASVIMEEINRAGGNSGACHGQMYIMGTLLRHGSEAQKREVSAQDRQRRAAAAIDGRHRADDRHATRRRSRPPRYARATGTSSTAKRYGSRASSIRI